MSIVRVLSIVAFVAAIVALTLAFMWAHEYMQDLGACLSDPNMVCHFDD